MIFYPNGPGRPSTRLFVKPFTHRDTQVPPPIPHQDSIDDHSIAVDLDPVDCVIFDARMTHTGETLNGPKYMIVLT